MAYKGVLLANEEKEIEERIENEETLFSWDTTIWSYIHGNRNQYLRVIVTFSPLITLFVLEIIHYITSDVVMTKKEMLTTSIALGVGMLFFCILMRVYVVSDIKCTFLLKKSGIITIMKRELSSSSIAFVRFIGFSGVIICFFSVIYIGPIAFAGGGFFALSTFKLVNYSSKESRNITVIPDKVMFFDLENRNIIDVVAYPYRIPDVIYYDDENKNLICEKLNLVYNVIGFYKQNKYAEYLNHPAMLEAVKVNKDIRNEMRSLGMDV